MNLANVASLQSLIRARRSEPALPAGERALYENFAIEERVTAARLHRYAHTLGAAPLSNLDAFWQQHRVRYLDEHQFVEKDEGSVPDTFNAALSGPNFWTGIDDNVVLYRLEQVSWALKGSSVDQAELERSVRDATTNPGPMPDAARTLLQRVVDEWNNRRNLYPSFATTSDEVTDLLAQPDWVDRLRDHLGLGHLNPAPGRTEAVLLMRYTVKEVHAARAARTQGFCIPTVLDGTLNPWFFPTPARAGIEGAVYEQGRAVNLAPARTESDYRMGLELIHSYLDYRPEHIVRWGLISRPHQADLAQQRRWHLSWLQLNCDRDDFACELNHV
ncbi:hypothetical protein C7444_108178 [Sphaerotilus hippei]|uniref:Uncharacterized protein n=1 Tax=Sphaerotilus hippei TaxID=744406 RepID=A0A318H004_9BURK|nr:hypothetical protein [Sphaerotilus hippei]PXW95918.1 hypothetical protein C7444_108178 [Sphaerotilus hippei]